MGPPQFVRPPFPVPPPYAGGPYGHLPPLAPQFGPPPAAAPPGRPSFSGLTLSLAGPAAAPRQSGPAGFGDESGTRASGAAPKRGGASVTSPISKKKVKAEAACGLMSKPLAEMGTVAELWEALRTQIGGQSTNPVVLSDLKRLAQNLAETGKHKAMYRSIQYLIAIFEAHPNLRGPMLVGFIYSMFLVCEDGTPAYLQQALNTEAGALCRKEIPEKVTIARQVELEFQVRDIFEKKWEKGAKLTHEGKPAPQAQQPAK